MTVGPFDEELVVHGGIVGILTFVVGVGLVLPLLLVGGGDLGSQTRATPVAMAATGWLFLHSWPVLLGLPSDVLVLSVVPAALLAVVGYVTARRTATLDVPARYRGAGVVFGYFPATLVAFSYVVVRSQLAATGEPALVDVLATLDPGLLVAVVGYTGILFPVGFGGVGGYVLEYRAARRDDD
jgi:hypothetical protein